MLPRHEGHPERPVPVFYRLHQALAGTLPGAEKARHTGGGQYSVDLRPFPALNDPRRLDICASCRDPLQRLLLRRYLEPGQIPVVILLDLSRSMAFGEPLNKIAVAADCIQSLVLGAHKNGDPMGLLGYADRLEFYIPPASPLRLQDTARRLLQHQASGEHAGLTAALAALPARRCLLFWLSDFHLPESLMAHCLRTLQQHIVVPVVMWDQDEIRLPFGHSLLRMAALEGAQQRSLLLQKGFRRAVAQAYRQQRKSLHSLFDSAGRRPFWLFNRFSPAALSAYFCV